MKKYIGITDALNTVFSKLFSFCFVILLRKTDYNDNFSE